MHAVVGVLSDDADPMVTVMKLEKAPQESYADIGGLDQQIQEIKVIVHYHFDHTIVWLVLCLFNFFFSRRTFLWRKLLRILKLISCS